MGLFQNEFYGFQEFGFSGFPVKIDSNCYEVIGLKQNRKHRRKRINKKWAKRYGFTQIIEPKSYLLNGTIIMHPQLWNSIKKLEKFND